MYRVWGLGLTRLLGGLGEGPPLHAQRAQSDGAFGTCIGFRTSGSPGSWVASAKVCPSTRSEPRLSTSVLKKPASEPLPYWIAKSVPLPCAHKGMSTRLQVL